MHRSAFHFFLFIAAICETVAIWKKTIRVVVSEEDDETASLTRNSANPSSSHPLPLYKDIVPEGK